MLGDKSNLRSDLLRVSATSDPDRVVGAILGTLRRHDRVEVSSIGLNALTVALKAIDAASSFSVAKSGKLLVFTAKIDADAQTESGAKPLVLTCWEEESFFKDRVLWRMDLRGAVESVAKGLVEELGESQSVAIRAGRSDVFKALTAIVKARASVSIVARVDMVFPDGSFELHSHFDNRG
ncbi:MAG: Stage V sporulation protein S [candidate division WS2 bacterium ADurb.Bin280]|uniref:Stage V sporulation protein S n=1 Tax=candidate division WS2 bacterium ADurb.Bin280 TaxID=1852829 RepID=A0A1V5SCM3_9BACT|nr:MAG: Stage V sporulation protein S [candidate division WS2 bacterium ADurb.Bin280]